MTMTMTMSVQPEVLHYSALSDWVREINPDAIVDLDSELIESGIIDSMQFAELIMLIEEIRGQEIEEDDMTVENFSTLRAVIAAFL